VGAAVTRQLYGLARDWAQALDIVASRIDVCNLLQTEPVLKPV